MKRAKKLKAEIKLFKALTKRMLKAAKEVYEESKDYNDHSWEPSADSGTVVNLSPELNKSSVRLKKLMRIEWEEV